MESEESEYREDEIVDDENAGPAAEDDGVLDEYDINSNPNDFNIQSLVSVIDKGYFKIPGFQRNYVWDLRRASRLIESVILGLPIPQVFLYEKGKNEFLVIDGQQRLMSIYYFAKKRFPRKDRRPELRQAIDKNKGKLPENILEDDDLFQRFNLQLPSNAQEDKRNPLHGKNYATLGEKADTYDFRTIRSITIKQLRPEGDDSIFEIFNRLNSGGVNLRPQEMRSSLYHSPFFESIHELNALESWRKVLGITYPDVRMKDSEVLIRALAMLVKGADYRPSMVRFLNMFCRDSRQATKEEIALRKDITTQFLEHAAKIDPAAFTFNSKRLSVPVFEAVFFGCCRAAYTTGDPSKVKVPSKQAVEKLKEDRDFFDASRSNSADRVNVQTRLDKAAGSF